jgi:hypothetical protein
MTNLKLIVTGTGRCGTVFLSKFLTSIGVPCCHEGVFNTDPEEKIIERINDSSKRTLSDCSLTSSFFDQDKKEWLDVLGSVADSSYMAAPYLNHSLVRDIPLIHVIRNPIDVISSFILDFNYFSDEMSIDDEYQNFIYQTVPELKHIAHQIDRAFWFYYSWNKIIEDACQNRNYMRINIENFDKNKVYDFVGGDKNLINSSFNDIKSNTNNSRESGIPLENFGGFFKDLVFDKAKQYGYKMNINNLKIML